MLGYPLIRPAAGRSGTPLVKMADQYVIGRHLCEGVMDRRGPWSYCAARQRVGVSRNVGPRTYAVSEGAVQLYAQVATYGNSTAVRHQCFCTSGSTICIPGVAKLPY